MGNIECCSPPEIKRDSSLLIFPPQINPSDEKQMQLLIMAQARIRGFLTRVKFYKEKDREKRTMYKKLVKTNAKPKESNFYANF
jgi:hypothetical protein